VSAFRILQALTAYQGLPLVHKFLFLRPDRLKLTTAKHADILLTIANCTFNGKCYELLTETKTGNSCIVYTERSFTPGKTMPFCIK